MDVAPKVAQWLISTGGYKCLIDPRHCLFDNDVVFRMTIKYNAYLDYLDAHPRERVPELRDLVRAMVEHVVAKAANKRNLILLGGPRPTLTTLEQARLPRIKEFELAIDVFGRHRVFPMHRLLICLGHPEPTVALMHELYSERLRQLSALSRAVPKSVLQSIEQKANPVLDADQQRAKSLLARIKPIYWNNLMGPIINAARNIGDDENTMKWIVYQTCPPMYHGHINKHFEARLQRCNGMWKLEYLRRH